MREHSLARHGLHILLRDEEGHALTSAPRLLSLTEAHWDLLRSAWEAGVTTRQFVCIGNAQYPGTPQEAATYDEWCIVDISPDGMVLGEAERQFYVIADDRQGRGPIGVNVTRLVQTFPREITPFLRPLA